MDYIQNALLVEKVVEMKKSMHLVAILVAVGVVALLYLHVKALIAEYRQPAEKTKVVQTIKGKPKEGVVSAYVPNQPVEDDDGYHALVIDNSNNENPVYARLWTTGEDAHPIRAFTICEHGSFKMENLPSGTYELRFKMLYEGNDAVDGYKVDGIVLEPKQVEGGVSYPTYTLQIALRNGKGEASKHTLASDV